MQPQCSRRQQVRIKTVNYLWLVTNVRLQQTMRDLEQYCRTWCRSHTGMHYKRMQQSNCGTHKNSQTGHLTIYFHFQLNITTSSPLAPNYAPLKSQAVQITHGEMKTRREPMQGNLHKKEAANYGHDRWSSSNQSIHNRHEKGNRMYKVPVARRKRCHIYITTPCTNDIPPSTTFTISHTTRTHTITKMTHPILKLTD